MASNSVGKRVKKQKGKTGLKPFLPFCFSPDLWTANSVQENLFFEWHLVHLPPNLVAEPDPFLCVHTEMHAEREAQIGIFLGHCIETNERALF